MNKKIVMLTAYDYPMAVLLDQAGVDYILVGDSLANVALGLNSTTEIGMNVMLHHAAAVCRGAGKTKVVVDMPFEAYQKNPVDAVNNAKKLMDVGAYAVKVEWFEKCPDVVCDLRSAGIHVMGHVGLTPQTAQEFKVQGKDEDTALKIQKQAQILQEKGCFSIVLECIPQGLAKIITESLTISTIGIGAGPHCDGQVLVSQDMLGLYQRKVPKFVKCYSDLGGAARNAFQSFFNDVQNGTFPSKEQSF